tara:strand:- start:263 stop:628 length:366 start_codon:yes stop_codon:yes gene_type:complete
MKYLEKEIRPWGQYYIISNSSHYKLKIIEVNPNSRLSYQYHKKRSECWTIIKGIGLITINGLEKKIIYGDSVTIKQGDKHRIKNIGDSKLTFVEVQTGTYFGEDDIVRLDDDYNRIKDEQT